MPRSLQQPFDLERVFNVQYFGDPWHGLITYYWLDDFVKDNTFADDDAFIRTSPVPQGLALPNGQYMNYVSLPYGTDVFWYKYDDAAADEITTETLNQQNYWDAKGIQWLNGGYIYGNGRYGVANIDVNDDGRMDNNVPYSLSFSSGTEVYTYAWVYFDDLGRGWEIRAPFGGSAYNGNALTLTVDIAPMPRDPGNTPGSIGGGPGDYSPVGEDADPNDPLGRAHARYTVEIPAGLHPTGYSSFVRLMDAARNGKKALYLLGQQKTRPNSIRTKFANVDPPELNAVFELQLSGTPGEVDFALQIVEVADYTECWGQLDTDNLIDQRIYRRYRTPFFNMDSPPFSITVGNADTTPVTGNTIFHNAVCVYPPDAGDVSAAGYAFMSFGIGDNGFDTYVVYDNVVLGTPASPFTPDLSFPNTCFFGPDPGNNFPAAFEEFYGTFINTVRETDTLVVKFADYLVWACYDDNDDICKFMCDLQLTHDLSDGAPVGYEQGTTNCDTLGSPLTEHSFTRSGYSTDLITYTLKRKLATGPETVLKQDTLMLEITANGYQQWGEDAEGTMYSNIGEGTRTKKLTVNGSVVYDLTQIASSKGVGSIVPMWSGPGCPSPDASGLPTRSAKWNNFIAGWTWAWLEQATGSIDNTGDSPIAAFVATMRNAASQDGTNPLPIAERGRGLINMQTEVVFTGYGLGVGAQPNRGRREQDDIDDRKPIPSHKVMVYNNKLLGGFWYPARDWAGALEDAFYNRILQPDDLLGIYPWTTTGLFAPNYTDDEIQQTFTETQDVFVSDISTFVTGSDIWSTYDPRTGAVVRNSDVPVCFK
jgi:hypothetical protein